MLTNKSKDLVKVKYNGIDITVNPGEDLDVRDFNVEPKNIKDVENHIIRKLAQNNIKPFVQTERKTDSTSVKQFAAEIEALTKDKESLTKALADAKIDVDKLAEQYRLKTVEVQGLGEKIQSLEAENANLKAQIKAQSFPDKDKNANKNNKN